MGSDDVLQTQAFRQAIASIQRRAEKQTNWQRLADVFVKTDLFDRVGSPDSQLILGRRGTGKTHLMRFFEKDSRDHGHLALYIDCARLGSGYSGLNVAPEAIAQKYFVSLLNQLGTDLLDLAIGMELPPAGKETQLIGRLSEGLVPSMQIGEASGPTFNYRQIAETLEQVITGLQASRLFIILDEWAQVPFGAQPFLAQYLKSTVLSVPQIALKLLAVNYQCQFSMRRGGDLVGLELGADIPDVIDMDRYLVYDEKRDFVTSFFAHLLYNHLAIELGWDLTVDQEKKRESIERLFTQQRAFFELVRAAEGNCRDFLCIFARAYFDEFRQSSTSKSISIPNVTRAAGSWYDTGKASTINSEPEAYSTLVFIWNNVLKNYKSRTFLVESSKADHPRLTRLLNERVLHRLNGTYSHADRPGILHDLFTIDYGAFVRFRGTVNEVRESVFWEADDQTDLSEEEQQLLVPVDDRRSIRRITFDPETMVLVGDTRLKANEADDASSRLF